MASFRRYTAQVIHTKILGYGAEREARSPHDCRRTYASLEYLNCTKINVIQEQLGHNSVGQTWEYIKNVVEPTERRSQLKGGGILFKKVKSHKQPKNVVDAVWTHKIAKKLRSAVKSTLPSLYKRARDGT